MARNPVSAEDRGQSAFPALRVHQPARDNTDEAKMLLSENKEKTPRLLHYHEIPPWQQENEYILSGYRPTSGAWIRSLQSLCYLHNETVSTYAHMAGCVVFLLLPFHFYHAAYVFYPEAHLGDLATVTVYLLGVAVCFALSATCHLVWNHSPAVAAFGNKLDYLGILVLMWGASIPTIFYGFHGSQKLQVMYWTLMTGAAIGCAICTMDQRFSLPRFRRWRAALYAAFGLSSVTFVLHGLVEFGWDVQKDHMALIWMAWMGGWNLIGASFYAARIPERWWPYTFDLFGASHQLFHVAVMIAACVHYAGLLHSFRVIRGTDDGEV